MAWETLEIEVTEQPELKYTAAGLALCTRYNNTGALCVAFAEMAEELDESVMVGDELQIQGYYKSYTWTGHNGTKHTQEDFIIREWKRMN